jgi:MinD-like ATPase involved in chromosome partitioning or flagellar assembly
VDERDTRDARRLRPAALPIVAVPLSGRDVLRAAFAWNLAIEVARLGGDATLLVPDVARDLWPEAGRGPLGVEVVVTSATELGALNRAGLDVAVTRAAETRESGVVLVGVPLAWLDSTANATALLRWVLLFASSERRDLMDAYALAKQVRAVAPEARVGLTIHGAHRVSEAKQAFGRMAEVYARRLGGTLTSYGLLVDDLHVYRAVAARRPIGLEHPQSRAARAMQDVARLILGDAREPGDG